MITRRGLIGSLLAAPAIIRTPGLLMPIRAIPTAVLKAGWAINWDGSHMGTFRYAVVWYRAKDTKNPVVEWFDHETSIANGETVTFTTSVRSLADVTEGETVLLRRA